MLQVVGLSWALIISYTSTNFDNPPTPSVVYVENEAVCLKDGKHIIENIKYATVTCIPIRADVPPKTDK